MTFTLYIPYIIMHTLADLIDFLDTEGALVRERERERKNIHCRINNRVLCKSHSNNDDDYILDQANKITPSIPLAYIPLRASLG